MDTPWLGQGETLVCLGDSLTETRNGYFKIVENKLAKLKIKVINAGVKGDKTPGALARLRSDVIAVKPDAVSIFLGTNDAAVGRGMWSGEPRIDPAAYKSNLIWIVQLCRQAGINKFSIATPAGQFEGEAYINAGGVLPLYCFSAREAADEAKARLVPLDTAFANEWSLRGNTAKAGLLLTCDGIHMTPEGHRLIASVMLKTWRFK